MCPFPLYNKPDHTTVTMSMKAVQYDGPFKVSIQEKPMPKLEHPDDVIVKVTTAGLFEPLHDGDSTLTNRSCTAICGSDLHMYEGRTAAEQGLVFGPPPSGPLNRPNKTQVTRTWALSKN